MGGGGVPWRWPASFPVAAAASLLLPGGRRAARVFSFSAGMSAGCARLPEEGRKREGCTVLGRGLPAPWRGLSSGRRGWARVDPALPKGTPGSRAAAAAEGNRGRSGRGRAGVPALRPAGPGLPGSPRSYGVRRGGVWVTSRPRAAQPASRSSSLCLPGLRVSV